MVGGMVHQGDLLKVERVNTPVLVVSKDFFNQSGEIIGCPVLSQSSEGPLRIPVQTAEISGVVHCEKLSLLDLNVRGYKKIDRISIADCINIIDAVQGIFDYI